MKNLVLSVLLLPILVGCEDPYWDQSFITAPTLLSGQCRFSGSIRDSSGPLTDYQNPNSLSDPYLQQFEDQHLAESEMNKFAAILSSEQIGGVALTVMSKQTFPVTRYSKRKGRPIHTWGYEIVFACGGAEFNIERREGFITRTMATKAMNDFKDEKQRSTPGFKVLDELVDNQFSFNLMYAIVNPNNLSQQALIRAIENGRQAFGAQDSVKTLAKKAQIGALVTLQSERSAQLRDVGRVLTRLQRGQ